MSLQAVLGMAYWLQLTFVPRSLLEGTISRTALCAIWAYESFGYFAMGVSGLFSQFASLAGN